MAFVTEVQDSTDFENFENKYDLTLDNDALKRFTEGLTGEEKQKADMAVGAVQDFWGTWVKGPNEIEAIGIETKGKSIKSVVMRLTPDKAGREQDDIVVPVEYFKIAFGVSSDTRNGKDRLKFVEKDGYTTFISAGDDEDKLHLVMSEIRINEVPLNPEVSFFVESQVSDLVDLEINEERGASAGLEDFINAWGDDVDVVQVSKIRDRVVSLGLWTEDGKLHEVNIREMGGLKGAYILGGLDTPNGLSIKAKIDDDADISSSTSKRKLDEIFFKMSINGKRLSPFFNLDVREVPYEPA